MSNTIDMTKLKSNISIQVYDNFAIVKHKNTMKTMKLESMVKLFKSTEQRIQTPYLPIGTIKYEESSNNINILLYHPATKFTATCFQKEYEGCIRPNLIMKYTLTKMNNTIDVYSISSTYCFGVVDSISVLNENTQLYGLPFPNIGSGGGICWGGNNIRGSIRSLMGLSNYVNLLFNSPFNDHIFNTGFLKNFGIKTPGDLFTYIQDKEHFPPEILENLGNDFKLKNI